MKKVIKTDEEWQQLLDSKQFMVTRRKMTEPPYSSEFALSEKVGLYSCVCCQEPLFDSSCKIDVKTGWPSFFIPASPDAVREEIDNLLAEQRIAVVCNCCDSHLGHVYEDGPEPSGLRYSINSLALGFKERQESAVQKTQSLGAAKPSEPKGWQPSEPAKKEGDAGSGSCGCD
jgi:peptide-methionine (R)-S-oxide reductase